MNHSGHVANSGLLVRIQHVVITRFSYRSGEAGTGGQRSFDPLKRPSVEHRLRLLEIAPLPSLLAQTEQEFDWILIIDRDLAADLRDRLSALVARRGRTHLHVFDPADDLGNPAWLEPYHPPLDDGDYLVTSNLDDDDALPRTFVRELKRVASRLADAGPPLLVLGATEITSWDLLLSERAPRGVAAPWHRVDPRGARVASCGFSIAARHPAYPFTAMGKRHVQAREYLDFGHSASHPDVEETRAQFREAAIAEGEDVTRFAISETFHDLSAEVGPVIMTNHRQNLQQTRVFEPKPGRVLVRGPETFPTTEIGWSALDRNAAHFGMTPRLRFERVRWQLAQLTDRVQRRVRARIEGRRRPPPEPPGS